jgi:hypothetical protein
MAFANVIAECQGGFRGDWIPFVSHISPEFGHLVSLLSPGTAVALSMRDPLRGIEHGEEKGNEENFTIRAVVIGFDSRCMLCPDDFCAGTARACG